MPYADPEKYRAYQRAYYAEHRAQVRVYNANYRAANIERVREHDRGRYKRALEENPTAVRQTMRRHHLRRKYGITPEQYAELRAVQGGRCAICYQRLPGLHVDHNHTTGAIRGLLCSPCNQAIGLLRDDPERARRASVYLAKGLMVFVE